MAKFLAGLLFLGVVLAGCSDDSANRDEAVEAAEAAGFTREQAECFVDGIIDEFGDDRLEELGDPNAEPEDITPEEGQKITEIAGECLGLDEELLDTSVPE
jgi:hypothetical protein